VDLIEIKAPNKISLDDLGTFSIFLAGSIDMGKAENWQETFKNALVDYDNLVLYNPRRDDWDPQWIQDIGNKEFRDQVNWELAHLETVDLIIFYFDPVGLSPISLLELGLFAHPTRTIVCCPEGYWRRGNVQVVCDRYDVQLVEKLDDLIEAVKLELNGKN
jgi:hypothetical protein